MKKLLNIKQLIVVTLISLTIYCIYINTKNNNIDYLTLGDSYALGLNSYNQVSYGYSDYLKDYFNSTNNLNTYNNKYTEENETINTLINKTKTTNNLKQAIRESDIITLSIGLNDIIYSLSKLPNPTDNKLDEIAYNTYLDFENLIEEITRYTTNKIYLVGYNNKIFTEDINYTLNKLQLYYQKNIDIIYIQTPKELENIPKYYPNPENIHPNTQGYKLIYEEIMKNY